MVLKSVARTTWQKYSCVVQSVWTNINNDNKKYRRLISWPVNFRIQNFKKLFWKRFSIKRVPVLHFYTINSISKYYNPYKYKLNIWRLWGTKCTKLKKHNWKGDGRKTQINKQTNKQTNKQIILISITYFLSYDSAQMILMGQSMRNFHVSREKKTFCSI